MSNELERLRNASELFNEYYAIPLAERQNMTLQNYVYDYMSVQSERLKTTCLAQEAEIARLMAGFDELKDYLMQVNQSDFIVSIASVLSEIKRITGEEG